HRISVARGDGRARTPGAVSATARSGLAALPGGVVGGHRVAQALGTHVGPVLLDVLHAGGAALLAEHDSPPGRNLREGRPQGVLFLVVDQDEEAAVLVVEGVGAQFHLTGYWRLYG